MSWEGFYSERYNLIACPIPKNAMTSIRMGLTVKAVWLDERPAGARSFCVLREPFDRAVSGYLQVRDIWAVTPNHPSRRNRHLARAVEPTEDALFRMFMQGNIDSRLAEYFKEIRARGLFDNHHLSQASYLYKWRASTGKIDVFVDFANLVKEIEALAPGVKMLHIAKSKAEEKAEVAEAMESYRAEVLQMYAADVILHRELIAWRHADVATA